MHASPRAGRWRWHASIAVLFLAAAVLAVRQVLRDEAGSCRHRGGPKLSAQAREIEALRGTASDAVVTGRLLSTRGGPVGGAVVTVGDALSRQRVRTSADGLFVLPRLPVGPARVVVTAPGHVRLDIAQMLIIDPLVLAVEPGEARDSADASDGDDGELAVTVIDHRQPGSPVRGLRACSRFVDAPRVLGRHPHRYRVVDSAGSPVRNATARDQTSMAAFPIGPIDEAGFFEVRGTCFLQVSAPGFAWSEPSDSVDGPVYTLVPEQLVSGTVRDPEGDAVAGASVEVLAYPSHANGNPVRVWAMTDAGGRFVAERMPASTKIGLVVQHPGWRKEQLHLRREQMASITVVFDAVSPPHRPSPVVELPEATLVAEADSGWDWYNVLHVFEGESTTDTGFKHVWSATRRTACGMAFEALASNPEEPFVLQPRERLLAATGCVTDALGRPVVGARVSARGRDFAELFAHAFTDERGVFHIAASHELHVLTAQHPDHGIAGERVPRPYTMHRAADHPIEDVDHVHIALARWRPQGEAAADPPR